MKKLITTLSFALITCWTFAQIPTDNPYKTFYQTMGFHWTDSIAWSNTFNITTFGGNGNGVADNITAVNNAINAAHNAGGGVVFFPAGTYFISDTIRLKSGVVLRGETLNINNAKDSAFKPSSKLLFPKYEPTFSGSGTPNTTAFRTIELFDKNEKNFGLVNLDINRASISFHPKLAISTTRPKISTGGGTNNADNWQPITNPHNCIVMGVRSNNATIPDPGVPTAEQNQWQRFTWRFAANIDVTVIKNAVIANCRLNDSVTDNYNQPNYICRNCPNVTNNTWGEAPAGVKTDFNYTDHLGISVNRGKIHVKNGAMAIEPFHWYPFPNDEPLLFAKGIEVLDNWVYTTMRVKITAAGWGLKVYRNVTRDSPNKTFFLSPNGQRRNTNFSATYENRGIDFSGFDVEIVENDVQVYNGGFAGTQYRSICGEGIMNQGNSGGSRINGVLLRKNKVSSNAANNTNPSFTLYRLYHISNVIADSNEATGSNQYMLIDADQGTSQYLHNVRLEYNKVNSINL